MLTLRLFFVLCVLIVKVLQSILDHGGLDAMIYLCGSVHGYELHALATNSLAILSENRKFI
jgi:hypothetical protein